MSLITGNYLILGSDTTLDPTVFHDRKSISALLHVLYNCADPDEEQPERQKIMVRCPLVRRFKVGIMCIPIYGKLQPRRKWLVSARPSAARCEHERELLCNFRNEQHASRFILFFSGFSLAFFGWFFLWSQFVNEIVSVLLLQQLLFFQKSLFS